MSELDLPILPNVGEKESRKREYIEKVEPVYIRKCLEMVDNHKLSDFLGCHYNSISPAKIKNGVRKSWEYAAKLYWLENFEQSVRISKDDMVFISMMVPKDIYKIVSEWLSSAGIKFHSYKE